MRRAPTQAPQPTPADQTSIWTLTSFLLLSKSSSKEKSIVITNRRFCCRWRRASNFSEFLEEQPENSVERNRSWGPHYFSVRETVTRSPPPSWANLPVKILHTVP